MSTSFATRKTTLVDLRGFGAVARRATARFMVPFFARRAVRRALFLLAISCVALVLAAGSLELRLRNLAASEGPGRIAPHQRRGLEPTGTVVRSLIPGLSWVRRPGPAGPGVLPLNAWGFHDQEIPIPKPEGHYRIVIVGDSMTFGRAVGDPALTYASRLEDLLQERVAPGRHIDVLNLGIEGYQAVQSYSTLRRVAFENFEPDLVVYAFYVNDLIDTRLDFYVHPDRYGQCEYESTPPSLARLAIGTPGARLRFWLKARSSLYEETKHRLAVLRIERVLPWLESAQSSRGPLATQVIEWWRARLPLLKARIGICNDYFLTQRAIAAMADLTRAEHVPFLIFTIPQFEQLGDGGSDGEGFLRRACRLETGITCHDPTPDLERALHRDGLDRWSLGVSATDQHPNVYGHTLLAASLADALEALLQQDGVLSQRSASRAVMQMPDASARATAIAAFTRKARGSRTRSAPVTRQAPRAETNRKGKATMPSTRDTAPMQAIPTSAESHRARVASPGVDSYSRPSSPARGFDRKVSSGVVMSKVESSSQRGGGLY